MSEKLSHSQKQLLEFLPLVVFFIVYLVKRDLVWATGVLVVLTVLSMGYIFLRERTLSKIQLFSLALIVFFGGLTVYLNDPAYIKAKVSIINGLFAAILFGGYFMKRMFIKDLMGQAIALPDHAWSTLTLRWGFFFLFLAVLNLIVWFQFSETVWATFKFVGLMGLTLVFALANAPFMARHMQDEAAKPSADG